MSYPGESIVDQAIEDLVYRQPIPADRVVQQKRVEHGLAEIVRERIRQESIGERKRAEGIDWRSCADPEIFGGELARYAVLGEEFGEVGRAILEAGYASSAVAAGEEPLRFEGILHLRAELVQVAAVSLAWLESIDVRLDR